MRIVFILLATLFIQKAFAGCNDGGIISPQVLIAEDATKLLQHKEFTKLDQLAGEYLAAGEFDSSGKPKLMGLYAGLSNSNANCDETTAQTERQWKKHQRLLLDWKKASPKSEAAALSLALFMESYGWHARGSGFADTVSSTDWKIFKARFADARAQLERMSETARDNPAWYEGMLRVGLAQGWSKESFNAIFSEGVKKFPSYYALYYTKGEFLTPKWYGSEEEFQEFVEESVEATKSQLGQTLYARIEASQARAEKFQNRQINYNRLQDGFRTIISDFPGAWNENIRAKFACMANDYKFLRIQLKSIGSQVAYGAWSDKEYYDRCKKYAQTRQCWTWADDGTTECEPPLENSSDIKPWEPQKE